MLKTLALTYKFVPLALVLGGLSYAVPCLAATPTPKVSTLKIGDPAPPLQPAKWLKGAAVSRFEKGQVYVVEFWATWCGPCKANIPHLTELAKKFQGKAKVIGVDIWESPDPTIETLPRVTAFVKSQGKRMDYLVAADTTHNRVADAWMKAADEASIPMAFVIGRDGRIAWMGNAAAGLDAILKQVVDDKFDVAAAGADREKQVGPRQEIDRAMAAKDFAGALKLVDDLIARNPETARGYAIYRFIALAHIDVPAFEKGARETITQSDGAIEMYQMLCSIPASQKDLSPDVYQFGRSLVDEALLKKDREYLFLAMGAAMDSSLGKNADAVRDGEAAVKAAETDTHCPPDFLKFLRNNLEKYKAAAG